MLLLLLLLLLLLQAYVLSTVASLTVASLIPWPHTCARGGDGRQCEMGSIQHYSSLPTGSRAPASHA